MSHRQPDSHDVFCTTSEAPAYHRGSSDLSFRELPPWTRVSTALVACRALLTQAGLDQSNFGSPHWNPLGAFIDEGARVVVKPNWVNHKNLSGHSLDCLVTHTSVIEAILHYVAKARPRSIVVGDAPLQGCDFEALLDCGQVTPMIRQFTENGVNVAIKDFRRTLHDTGRLGGRARTDSRPLGEFLLYDLAVDSALEPITTEATEFRVTMYNPDSLKRTHARGKHQYLIARELIDADVVINAPKLKTHKKSCLTGALKNAVGINGHKEYLPHHRKGGSDTGGDCYSGHSRLSGLVEDLLDATNRAESGLGRGVLANAVRLGMAAEKVLNAATNLEGSWHGNDTVWRMTLDLQRILHYGQPNGSLSDRVQRTVVTITDAIVAGEGEGPLAPTPIALGMMTLGLSTAATEWVHALLMGLDPRQIPLTREAFVPRRYPLTGFGPDAVAIHVDGHAVAADELFTRCGRAFQVPAGWQGHVERAGAVHDLASHS